MRSFGGLPRQGLLVVGMQFSFVAWERRGERADTWSEVAVYRASGGASSHGGLLAVRRWTDGREAGFNA